MKVPNDCIADRVRLTIPQPTEWQHIGNEINAALIFARALTEEDAGDCATAKLQDRNYKRGGASFE